MTRLMTANLHHKRRSRLLNFHIWRNKPVAVAVSEGYNLGPIKGYTLHRAGGPDDSVVMLLRKEGTELVTSVPVPMEKKWDFNNKGLRGPRRYLRSRVRLHNKIDLRLLCVHFEPGGPHGENRAAWLDSMDRMDNFLSWNPDNIYDAPNIAFGDMNGLVDEIRDHTNHRVIKGGKVSHLAHSGKVHVTKVKRLRKPRWAHGWYVFHIDLY